MPRSQPTSRTRGAVILCLAALPLLLPARFAAAAAPTSAPGGFDVRSFGAKGDGTTLDSEAINRAIAAASAAGGGTVRFPAGTYLSVSIRLKSHVGLRLEHGATLEAASPAVAPYDEAEPNEWGDKHQYQDYGHSHWHNSLIWGENVQDVSITGPGLIYGKGLIRGQPRDRAQGTGDKAIALKNCRGVTIRDVSIFHGGWFAILATGVDDLTIDNVKIDTNRDGIDVDACRNVRISNSLINTPYDDGICPKSSFALGYARATENVTITNNVITGYDEGTLLDGTYQRAVKHAHGPTGRIKMGTESNGGFRNITISNCVLEYCRGLAIESVDGAAIEDVSISNITMRDIVNAPIFIRLGRRMRGPANVPVGVVRRVNISDVVASNVTAEQGVLIGGIPGHPIEDLRISNVRIAYQGGGTTEDAALDPPEQETDYPEPYRFGRLPAYGFFVRHVSGLDVHHVDVSADKQDLRRPFVLHDVARAVFDAVRAGRARDVPTFSLRNVKDLTVHNCPGLPDGRRDSVEHGSY